MKNQIEQTQFIKDNFSRFIRSTFDIRNEEYRKLFYKRLDELGQSKLYKGPYLASSLPFEPSLSISDLIATGDMNSSMAKLGGVDSKRPNYNHQIKCFKLISSGRNVVVTTGTGSGKTECFMLPIINSILNEKDECAKTGKAYKKGIRAIFLFPMNALVYDQIDRLRTLLSELDITFGFYTGKTPEDNDEKEKRKYIEKYGEPSKNELFTRKTMRATPPDILFTNYSMLEYLLIRPIDYSLISEEALSNWRFVVLDEAHTYRGALGIEISLLLRRLCGSANRKPQFILTSATLGRGKEDLPKIIDFANTLTSCEPEFEENDIVFGERHPLDSSMVQYSIYPKKYVLLFNALNNKEDLKALFSDYVQYDEDKTLSQNLYELLIRDGNVHELFRRTKNVADFYDVLNSFDDFDVDSLTSLIELVTKATSVKNLKLFDIKYHMFIKAPDGAFVSLGNNKDLSLISRNTFDNGMKAFKIGICSNCKTPYIMGITSSDNILSIDDEIDIDEAYQEKIRRLEYYLIADCLTPEEIVDVEANPDFEKYIVCAKCGYIKKASNQVTKNDCKCGDQYHVVLYKYNEKTSKNDNASTNNLHKCPICDYRSHGGGVVMGFHIGKDRATTLISQILYESMEYPLKKVEEKKFSLVKSEPKYIKLRKQFLAFSDSRQQAAFFSKFLNAVNDRFLKKSMIAKILVDNNYQPIDYLTLVNRLEYLFRTELKYTPEEANKHAKAAALWELMLVDGRNSGEGIGMFAFKLDFKGIFIEDDATLEQALKDHGFDITAQQFRDITSVVFNVFRTAPAIQYEYFDASAEEKDDLLGYRQFQINISLQETKKQKVAKSSEEAEENNDDDDDEEEDQYDRVKSFLPVEDAVTKKSSVNGVVKYVMKALKYDADKAKDLLRVIYETAAAEELIIPSDAKDYPGTNLIKASQYSIHSYKNLKYFRCPKCGKMTLYNVNGVCTEPDCNGILEEVKDVDEAMKNNYYRSEYLNRPIEKIICQEHTAQMNADEAKEIQNDFKEGKINFISCSTTFEMGIDLGGLNTIFMRNVPPTPANYAQRAGRAGRRAETSAYVLTFCGLSSHDYTYFEKPREMVRGLVKPPYFTIDNEKIIMRHINAAALSFYFRMHIDEYDSVMNFLTKNVVDHFVAYLKSKPQELGNFIDNYVLYDDSLKNIYGNFQWVDHLKDSEGALIKMKEGLKATIELYEKSEKIAASNKDYRTAKLCKDALDNFKSKNSLITYFTKYNVIPGYGFPVDNVELKIWDFGKGEMNDDYNLQRNLSIAISEYAPESEVIVDGKKYTSRYLMKPHEGASLPTTFYIECPGCHQKVLSKPNVNDFKVGDTCPYCQTMLPIDNAHVKSFVTPIYGFVAARHNKKTRRMKPAKTYASDIYYIGKGVPNGGEVNIKNVIKMQEFKDEQLLVLNESNFYICDNCGYTVILKKQGYYANIKRKHEDYRGKDCEINKRELLPTHLGHTYSTDVIKMSFDGKITEMYDSETALSTLYAILEGISVAYTIERDDISGIVFRTNETKPYDLILFDTVPGGAGHVKRLKESHSLLEVLEKAIEKVSQDCCKEDTSCYNCLRTYNNQKIHKHLKRGKARDALLKIKDAILTASSNFDFVGKDTNHFTNLDDVEAFIDDELLDEEINNLFADLIKEIKLQKAIIPDGYWIELKSSDGKSIHAPFYWKNKKILLFTELQREDYDFMNLNQNKYTCFMLNENLDTAEFVKPLRSE